MRVLMFGWEFPPYLSGGLGVACHDMTRALARKGIQVKFIQPQRKGIDEIDLERGVELCSASGTSVKTVRHMKQFQDYAMEFWEKNISIHSLDSPLTPYATPQTYDEYMASLNQYQTNIQTATDLYEEGTDSIQLNSGY